MKSITYILPFLWVMVAMGSCNVEPKPIKVGTDACSFCKMGVADKRFGAELITRKGKVYKFDDLHCLVEFTRTEGVKHEDIDGMYLVNYEKPHGFIELQNAFLFKSEAFKSPMGSNIAAFQTKEKLAAASQSVEGSVVQVTSLMPFHK
ncbi:nitrous oxide reductase accessory protein NosL [Pedobacter nutrimenti]|uniref:Copper chaperone NosL n=1 Tax=Pedobacter nutrimenti TaxID=1241337 RepID=A0A318UCG6_9SPHI|nr:nitrous oxide reductase accessory protein NosL [Pedobacter nutrimenti]PYF70607.1 copper chaperone NosL [Pedobacter nutrimenti]